MSSTVLQLGMVHVVIFLLYDDVKDFSSNLLAVPQHSFFTKTFCENPAP
jgi:hypothetical protein